MGGMTYLATAILLGGGFLYLSISLFKDVNNNKARQLFLYSIFYLFAIFLVLLTENCILR